LLFIGPSGFDSPDLAPLLVLCELLQAMEGLFWKLIRGQGLAYSTSLRVNVEYGNLSLYKIIFFFYTFFC
jgi:Zn-dependent M16 (insulinase) family peptidase